MMIETNIEEKSPQQNIKKNDTFMNSENHIKTNKHEQVLIKDRTKICVI